MNKIQKFYKKFPLLSIKAYGSRKKIHQGYSIVLK